jgi:hypothetical protein
MQLIRFSTYLTEEFPEMSVLCHENFPFKKCGSTRISRKSAKRVFFAHYRVFWGQFWCCFWGHLGAFCGPDCTGNQAVSASHQLLASASLMGCVHSQVPKCEGPPTPRTKTCPAGPPDQGHLLFLWKLQTQKARGGVGSFPPIVESAMDGAPSVFFVEEFSKKSRMGGAGTGIRSVRLLITDIV